MRITALVLLLLALPAQAVELNEPRWRLALQQKIRSGAPAADICSSAKSMAQVSDSPTFIDFAMDIARSYCPPGEIGKEQPAPPNPSQQKPVRVNGYVVGVCSHGGLCQSQLERAIKGPPRPGW